jgi:hypothetical protein
MRLFRTLAIKKPDFKGFWPPARLADRTPGITFSLCLRAFWRLAAQRA